MDLSLIIPAYNESEALPGLIAEIDSACEGLGLQWETIVIDDGSTDGTFGVISEIAKSNPRVGVVRLRRNFGKSVALAVGFDVTRGEKVITIDGDGQDDPADIPRLLEGLENGSDLVSGWKSDRQDPVTRRLASKIFNWFTARVTGVDLHDMNCGFKAYRGECARSIEVYGEMHRFLPAFAAQQGWRVTELPVNHRPRLHGSSRFGLERYRRGALDLLTVAFLGRYQNRPLHLFGLLGLVLGSLGFLICLYLSIIWIGGEAIGERPLLFLGVLLIVVGVQLFSLGLLGQMMVVGRRAGVSEEKVLIEKVLSPESDPELGLSRLEAVGSGR
ncbi:MAG TPA: glycosyltransferase family 2 protein [Solirubrobacterales bacterium]|nr:glycosyltransferase family 2 protein [Solirubrobacterales bacterium]HMX70252.1 glycosyltransferase family 2 protein [Solirubrobacterales bacterium]HMY24785.1 glycosyltransferase family 2 protein [Solirubrobacterales bacterium]HNA24453.1 glycosyltransferase family 2 protein [Solirubrobacterales bacterium]HNA43624.1 glycosyltransferase family 2 protein [Solirubrobacterales bacterium]